jgi:hypothetical protein
MLNRILLAALTCLVASGYGGSRGPIYEFQPTTGPLRYEIIDRGNLLIETPMGEQRAVDSTKATLRLEIGQRSAGGRQVSVVFESLDIWAAGDFHAEHIEGGEGSADSWSHATTQQSEATLSTEGFVRGPRPRLDAGLPINGLFRGRTGGAQHGDGHAHHLSGR